MEIWNDEMKMQMLTDRTVVNVKHFLFSCQFYFSVHICILKQHK